MTIATEQPRTTRLNVLTHSSESTFKTCPRKFKLRYRDLIVPDYDADPLRFGHAFHAGLEQLKLGHGLTAAVEEIDALYAETPCPPWLQPEEFDLERWTALAMVRGYHWRYPCDPILEYVAVELPFDLPIINPESGRPTPLFRSAGKIDGIAKLPDGRLAIVEHKTVGDSIEPGADYWRRLLMDAQISRYYLAARELGYDVSTTIYDVTRKPAVRPKSIPKADRALHTSKGNYHGVLLHDVCPEREMPEMFAGRLLDDMQTRPEFYFARNEIPRLASDLDEFRWEQWQIAQQIHQADVHGRFYRNTSACIGFGRCTYFDHCRGLLDSNDNIPTGFRRADDPHPELVNPQEQNQ
jgi:hypothetical protein